MNLFTWVGGLHPPPKSGTHPPRQTPPTPGQTPSRQIHPRRHPQGRHHHHPHPRPEMATEAGGTHPAGMHSCIIHVFNNKNKFNCILTHFTEQANHPFVFALFSHHVWVAKSRWAKRISRGFHAIASDPDNIMTRMHSSRMRTGRTLTVFRWRTPPRKFWRNPPRKIRAKSGAHPPKLEQNLEHPPCEQNEWQTGVKLLPWPKLRFGW